MCFHPPPRPTAAAEGCWLTLPEACVYLTRFSLAVSLVSYPACLRRVLAAVEAAAVLHDCWHAHSWVGTTCVLFCLPAVSVHGHVHGVQTLDRAHIFENAMVWYDFAVSAG